MNYENYSKIRDLAGMRDSQVARLSGIGTSTFSDWKKGRSVPKQEKLMRIADALGVSYATLLGIDEQPLEVPQYNPAIQEFIDILPKLTDEQLKTLIQTAQLFASMNDVQ